MVQLLKNQIHNITSSIYNKLIACFSVVLAISIGGSALILYNSHIVMEKYEKSMSQLLQLNEMYTQLDKVQYLVSRYSQYHEKEDYLELPGKVDMLNQSMESLAELDINQTYDRAILDLDGILQTYIEQVDKVVYTTDEYLEDPASVNKSNMRSISFGKLQNYYEMINNNFKSVYSMVLSNAEELKKSVQNFRKRNYIMNFLIIIASAVICIILAKRFANSITNPIKKLTVKARQVSKGNMELSPLIVETDDEMMILVSAFNHMIERIKEQILEIESNAIAKEKLHEAEVENLRISNMLKTSELKAYQARINPHFLFNTLNMISKEAYIEGSNNIMELLDITANLLRYSLKKMSHEVTLKDELENICDYIYLQEQRFGDRIQFIFHLDESFNDLKMPCLVLQPIIENAIIHGVGAYLSGGMIKIITHYEEPYIIISIIDNGVGITAERLKVIRESLVGEDSNEGIGLKNVYQRLLIFYGDAVQLQIKSIPNKETEITFYIPYVKIGEINV